MKQNDILMFLTILRLDLDGQDWYSPSYKQYFYFREPPVAAAQLLSLHRSLPCSPPARGKLKFPPLSLVHFRQWPPFIGCPDKNPPTSMQMEIPSSLIGSFSPVSTFHWMPGKKPANYYPYIARFLAPRQREVN
jgi:hypothetical protein